jgi:hypothetical protein
VSRVWLGRLREAWRAAHEPGSQAALRQLLAAHVWLGLWGLMRGWQGRGEAGAAAGGQPAAGLRCAARHRCGTRALLLIA